MVSNYSENFYNIIIYISLLKNKSVNFLYNLYEGKINEVNRIKEKDKSIFNHLYNLTLDPTHIIDNIYLGNAYNSSNEYTLKKFGIEKIINMTSEIPCSFPDDKEYLQVPIRDTRDNFVEKYLLESMNFIHKNSTKQILIHCYMGLKTVQNRF